MTWMDGDTFQQSTLEEEGIPASEEREDLDDGTKKDPKANAGAPDPATALVGSMTMGQGSASGGGSNPMVLKSEILQTSSEEEAENVEEAKKGLYANIHTRESAGITSETWIRGLSSKGCFKKAARTAKEEVSFELEGVTYF